MVVTVDDGCCKVSITCMLHYRRVSSMGMCVLGRVVLVVAGLFFVLNFNEIELICREIEVMLS